MRQQTVPILILCACLALGFGVEGQPSTESLPLGPAPSQSLPPSESPTGPSDLGAGVIRTGGALVLVVAIAFGASIGLKKLSRSRGGLASDLGAGGRAPSGVLSVLGRFPVARGQSLVILQMGGRVLLLNQAHQNRAGGPAFATLAEMTDAEEVADLLSRVSDATGDRGDERFREALASLESSPDDSAEVVDLTRGEGGFGAFMKRFGAALARGGVESRGGAS